MNENWKRPHTASEVVQGVLDAETFGRNVRDWQHELRKVPHKNEWCRRVESAPQLLEPILHDAGQCDAYLAAYVEWLCHRVGIEAPDWVNEPERFAQRPWFDLPDLWQDSFVQAPGSFRVRGVFTIPENVIHLRPGRAPVSAEHKLAMNALRQKRHRERVKEKLERLKDLESTSR
ncbi:MAG: hypothetical protein ABQ298_09235 [Puniceicoccaceae bacterium]